MGLVERNGHYHFIGTIDGERIRKSLNTTSRREAEKRKQELIAEVKAGKRADKAGRNFAGLPLRDAVSRYIEDRKGRVAEKTLGIDIDRSKPLVAYFKDARLRSITATDIAKYQRYRMEANLSNRSINMEVGILRQMLKRAKRWRLVEDDVKLLPENVGEPKKALTLEQKQHLFKVAASKPEWMVAYCAAILAATTTCRGVELKHLRWSDVDLMADVITIRRSKTRTGIRRVPITMAGKFALDRLRNRLELVGAYASTGFVFPGCENGHIDLTRSQRSWRTAWRNLTRVAGLSGFRFHDLRHQAITEMAESGKGDAQIKAIAGHLSNRMLEHYSHVRMEAKRDAVSVLDAGVI